MDPDSQNLMNPDPDPGQKINKFISKQRLKANFKKSSLNLNLRDLLTAGKMAKKKIPEKIFFFVGLSRLFHLFYTSGSK